MLEQRVREDCKATGKETKFLRNIWYVAGYSRELDENNRLTRRLLGEAIFIFRTGDGWLCALRNRCPHRFAPLSMGRLEGDAVRCAYHGLAFDGSGSCSHNPHGPKGALSVRAYPIVEQDGLLWIWMGAPDQADRATIPDFGRLDPQQFHVRSGYLHGQAPYELMSDNILDLSHIEFLHPLLGTPEVSQAKVEVRQEEGQVIVRRHMRGEVLPAGLAQVYRTGARAVDRMLEVVWHPPASMVLTVSVATSDGGPDWQSGSQTLHIFTPETSGTTHYFYVASLARDKAGEEAADGFFAALELVFTTEDKPMIDAQAAEIGEEEFEDLRPALLPIDKGPVLARRRLKQMIEAEC